MNKLHFIHCDFGKLGTSFVERDRADMDRATTIKDIADGQYDDVLHVIEVDLDAGTSRDVTAEILKAAGREEVDTGPGKPSAYDLARDRREALTA